MAYADFNAPLSASAHPMAKPGFGKRTPDSAQPEPPPSRADFAHLPERAAYLPRDGLPGEDVRRWAALVRGGLAAGRPPIRPRPARPGLATEKLKDYVHCAAGGNGSDGPAAAALTGP
ncbi:hypothetical protein [Streptomyces sp. NPDC006784]|uniref:hypothetical protein n=1 Tax=Streptomyces sp. NPDC006784 TaxID=3364764 RepID=UPI0036C15487